MNNLKLGLRTLSKNKSTTFINIFGLSIGIAAAVLLYSIVAFENSFNKDFENFDRIVRITSTSVSQSGVKNPTSGNPIPAMRLFSENLVSAEHTTNVREVFSNLYYFEEGAAIPTRKLGFEDGETPLAVDPGFFDIFNFKWLAGSPESLGQPGSVVLTRSHAALLWDDVDQAMGKTIRLDGSVLVKITGILEDLPLNIDFNFPYVISYETVKSNAEVFQLNEEWGSCSSNDQFYALLKKGIPVESLDSELTSLVSKDKYFSGGDVKQRLFSGQRLSDLHFNSELSHSGSHRVSKSRLQVLQWIGLIILAMASFNYINLSLAQSSEKIKDVGIRKALGVSNIQLIKLHLTETAIVVGVSFLLAMGLVYLARPFLSTLSDLPADYPIWQNPALIKFGLISLLMLTIVSGLYPALSLAKTNPVEAIHGLKSTKSSGVNLRKIFVVAQFAVAQCLVIGSFAIINQLNYINNKDLGFNKEQIYSFYIFQDSLNIPKQAAFKRSISQIPGVLEATYSSDLPLSGNTWMSNFRYEERPDDESFGITIKYVDEDYRSIFDLKMKVGKWFSDKDSSRHVVLNEEAIIKMGIDDSESVLGKRIRLGGGEWSTISGVVENFHSKSLKRGFEPMIILPNHQYYQLMLVKIPPSNPIEVIAEIERTFDHTYPDQIFSGSFYDEILNEFYEDDIRLSRACKIFGLITVIIACLGLFGLATFAAGKRTKEIGIRKVLGAGDFSLFGILSIDFLRLVVISFLIAAPLSWLLINRWLSDFEYKEAMGWAVFVIGFGLSVLISILSISYQSIKVITANPVDSLRIE